MFATKDSFVNAGTIAAAVLAVLLVALSTYGRRCRHPVVRLLMWGASIVFLPLTSSIVSVLQTRNKKLQCVDELKRSSEQCRPDEEKMWTLLLWIVLVLAIKSNAHMAAKSVSTATASPATDDSSIDGQRIKPTIEHLLNYAWVTSLIIICLPLAKWLGSFNKAIFVVFSAIGPFKAALKLVAFWTASGSYAVSKNARLIAGYMAQLGELQHETGDGQAEHVPRYIVMGEKKKHVVECPQGYRIKREVLDNKLSDLVTLDRVWQLAEHGQGLIAERQELRDLCLSYSLFKILRRRLKGYPVAEAGSQEALEFVLRGMDSVGTGGSIDSDRVFRVLVHEFWFASDFYYSPIPLCLFGGWAATLNYFFSVLIIAGAFAMGWIVIAKKVVPTVPYYYYYVITFSLLLVLVLVETWEIIAGVCSNWTKMALLGHYIRHQSLWQRSSCLHAALAYVLRLRPASRWSDKIGQNSMLEPGRFRSRTGLLSEQLYGRSGLMKSIKVSSAVKDAVFSSLLSSYGRVSKQSSTARRVGGTIDWALYGSKKSSASDERTTTDLILMWHIGTRLFEMKSTSASADMIAASHLSNYCAYLVAAAPELLPDCAAWIENRYKKVADDLGMVLLADSGGGHDESTSERYERLVTALSQDSHDMVLQRGVEIGQHLVKEYADDQASACRILADFWSEMLLYAAPSENVKGHVEAMARGGEFITLVWALLLHAGITTRPEAPDRFGV